MRLAVLRFLFIVVFSEVYAARKKIKPRLPELPVLSTIWPGYDPLFRPGEIELGGPTTVNFSLVIDDVVYVKEGTMQSAVNFLAVVKMAWFDPRLAWTKDQLAITKLHFPTNKLWTPDIRLLRNLEPKMELDTRVRATVTSSGRVSVDIPAQLLVHCGRPRDSRANWECFLRFSSWTYDDAELDLRLVGDRHADMTNYDDRVWLIAGNIAWRANSTRDGHMEIGYSIKILRR